MAVNVLRWKGTITYSFETAAIATLSPNDAYVASQGAGFGSLECSVRAGQLRPFFYSAVGVFPFAFFFFCKCLHENVKFCNLNPGFCVLHRAPNSGTNGLHISYIDICIKIIFLF